MKVNFTHKIIYVQVCFITMADSMYVFFGNFDKDMRTVSKSWS